MNIPEFGVLEFSNSIKRVIEDAFGYVRIRGEITGFKEHRSGHLYFNLKEDDAVISSVCFKNSANLINFKIENGIEVIASGRVTSYSGRSNYQIIVEKLEIAGIGALIEKIEKLKKKLAAEGLFLDDHKKKIPYMPHKIGIITSKTGAVIEDIKHRISDRFPLKIMLFNAAVQGAKAIDDVCHGIKFFNNLDEDQIPDLIIIARGGGSFEDLLAFNDEKIVRAVFLSKIPIISAIGHETDITLTDLVADLRAPTPTAAAELATPNIHDLKTSLEKQKNNLEDRFKNILKNNLLSIDALKSRLIHPQNIIQQNFDRLKYIFENINNNIFSILKVEEKKIDFLKLPKNQIFNQISQQEQKINKHLIDIINNYKNNIFFKMQKNESLKKILENSSFKSILERGFAIVKNKKGIIKKIKDTQFDDKISIELADGEFDARVIDKKAPELF